MNRAPHFPCRCSLMALFLILRMESMAVSTMVIGKEAMLFPACSRRRVSSV